MWLLLFVALTALLSGCSTADRTVSFPLDQPSLQAGAKTHVLVRIQCDSGMSESQFAPHLFLASIDRQEWPRLVATEERGSRPADSEGWVSWSLPPGLYCLLIHSAQAASFSGSTHILDSIPSNGAHAAFAVPGQAAGVAPGEAEGGRADYWFEVPRTSSTLYLGSLHWKFSLQRKHSWYRYRMPEWAWLGYEFTLDEAGARREAARVLGHEPTLLVQPLTLGPLGEARQLGSSSVTYQAGSLPSALQQPSWGGRGVERATGLGSHGVSRDKGTRFPAQKVVYNSGGGAGGGGEILLVALACYVTYLPVGTTVGSIKGHELARAMSGFSADFCRGLAEQNPNELLLRRFQAALPDAVRTGNPAGTPLRCEVSLVRAELRECEPRATFCLELAARLIWRRSDTGATVMERLVSSTNERSFLPGSPPLCDRTYETVVFASPAHKLDSLRADGGVRLLLNDVPAIVEAMAAALAAEWKSAAPAAGDQPPSAASDQPQRSAQ